MHILYIHQYFMTNQQSGSTRSYDLAKILIENGHRVTIFAGNLDARTGELLVQPNGSTFIREEIEGIEVYRVSLPFGYHGAIWERSALFVGFMLLSIFFVLTRIRPDLIYATSTPITVGIPALIANWVKRIPFVFEVRDLWPDFPVDYGVIRNKLVIRLMYWMEKLIYRQAVAIVATSPWMQNKIIEKGITDSKVYCVPIGVDITQLYPECREMYDVRSALGLADDVFLVVYAGAHGIPNALDTLLEAAALNPCKSIHYLLVGDGRHKRELVKFSQDHNLEEHVTFWSPLPRQEIGPILANADLCVIMARGIKAAEAIFPNKLFDYLACGVPILVNFEGDTASVLVENQCVFDEPCEDPKALAEFLTSLVNQHSKLKKMGTLAREVAVNQFDRAHIYLQVCKIVEGVCEHRYVERNG